MGCERRAPVWQQGQGQVLLLPPLSDRYMPTAWGCGVVIAAWKGGSARLHAPDGSSWSRWVRTAQGRPASRRVAPCGPHVVGLGRSSCVPVEGNAGWQWWWWWCVGWVSWAGGPPPRRVSARCHGRWHGEQPRGGLAAGCRSTCSDSRHFPALNVPFRTWSGPPPTPAILATLFLYAFPPSSADGPAGVLDIFFVAHTASQQSREHTYNLLFPHVSWGPGGRRVRRESMP